MILPNSILCIRGLRSGQICCANIYLPINYRNNKTNSKCCNAVDARSEIGGVDWSASRDESAVANIVNDIYILFSHKRKNRNDT